MSRILSILLIGLYALTLSQAYMPHIDYWMNKDFIASELCENQDKPELKCDGKCHLKKEIQQSEQEQNDSQQISVRLMVEFFQPITQFVLRTHQSIEQKKNYPSYSEVALSGHFRSIFHPPKA